MVHEPLTTLRESRRGTLGFRGDPFLIQRLGAIGVQPGIVQARELLNKN
jgi:hypothetical protein